MKPFLCDDFLLTTPTARTLYHDVAKKQPIVDYHCHLDPQAIYEDVRFENITQLWLGGDHYKWRILRSNGVDEQYITGNAPDREKLGQIKEAIKADCPKYRQYRAYKTESLRLRIYLRLTMLSPRLTVLVHKADGLVELMEVLSKKLKRRKKR